MMSSRLQALWPAIALGLLFVTAIVFRPVLPIDETRYLSVAWEMHLRGDPFAPLTMNFELYHHKPPLLFWLINASWSVFGVSRWAGTLPIVLVALADIYLVQALAKKLFHTQNHVKNLPLMMMASIPFMILNTIVMFDLTLMMFVLGTLWAMVAYSQKRHPAFILLMGLCLGLGLLTKGPVAWLYVLFPILLAPYWMREKKNYVSWYTGCLSALLLSLIPVALWLIPVLKASDPDFAFSLLWEQTAGRISGKMGSSHDRPFYFYLPLLPVLFLPWLFFPSFWSGLRRFKTSSEMRFLACWFIPTILAFSLIGGKQAHYLIPLLPAVLIFISAITNIKSRALILTSLSVVSLFIVGQFIASQNFFKAYDLQPVANYIHAHDDEDWAYVRKYQGELTFTGRLESSLDNQTMDTLDEWFVAHPQGKAVIRYEHEQAIEGYTMIMTIPYRSKHMGIFEKTK